MESQGIRTSLSGSSQEYSALGGQKRLKSDGLAFSLGESATPVQEQGASPATVSAAAQDYPALSSSAAWSLLGEVQAQALASSSYKLAEAQPVATRSLVRATYV